MDTQEISLWFYQRQQKSAMLNAQMHILNQLVRILREHNQFDEEQACFNRIRHLHHSLWMRQRRWRFIFWPILRYVEFLLNSFGRFAIAIIGLVVVLTLLYGQMPEQTQAPSSVAGFDPFWEAFHRFFNHTMPPSGRDTLWTILTVTGVIAGLGHVGIFISYMYTLVARK